jgi:hypothetical protein
VPNSFNIGLSVTFAVLDDGGGDDVGGDGAHVMSIAQAWTATADSRCVERVLCCRSAAQLILVRC